MVHILYILIYMSPLTTLAFLFLSSLPPLFFPNQMLSLNHLSARWTEGATMRPILGMSLDVRRTFLSSPQSCRKSSSSGSSSSSSSSSNRGIVILLPVWPVGGSILHQCCGSDGQVHAFPLPASPPSTGKRVWRALGPGAGKEGGDCEMK